MTLPEPIAPVGTTIERGPSSPVRSHISYDPNVEAICHHSGQYLTKVEINPQLRGFLREQHDFPGFPALDDLFARAAHARTYQHLSWSTPAVEALAMLVAALLVALGIVPLFQRAEQWQTTTEFVIVYIVLAVAGMLAVGLFLRAFILLRNRKAIYHRRAAGTPPAIDDFPVLGSYKIDISEEAIVDLRNDQRRPPVVEAASGVVRVELRPEASVPGHYATYRKLYAQTAGSSLHGGAIAFDGIKHVVFLPDLEYGHRLVLRQNTAEQFAPDGMATTNAIVFDNSYTISPDALYNGQHEAQRFLIDVQPELKPFDSYTMVVRFCWTHAESLPCQLEECRLRIPPELTPISNFDLGRYVPGPTGGEIVWRRLPFTKGEVALSITCNAALIDRPLQLQGSYRIICDGSVSGISIRQDHIWNALGRRATERTQPSIRLRSVIAGKLEINTALFSQEHEYVFAHTIETTAPPDHHLVEQIEHVLSRCGVDIQKIEQAMTRLDPFGKLEHELRYWDIAGRRYEETVLEAVDVHIVVAGSDASGGRLGASQSQVDIRVRCLHDPRNQATVQCVLATGQQLVEQLNQVIGIQTQTVENNGSGNPAIHQA